ncbi:MAG: histidine--tRNA ligase [Spirochaetia bacterium]|uniref:histidine--tRNA ligase n=1 Tax=bioreactor metagenome TaxID=1076179 RepID=A0A644THP3_9ZZZZ|nr:histidine--tRNA ligase [Spirochaetia bacterium]MCE1209066.1 histidine--tRNA ligase [Spirochaetia bacterium]HOI21933.1 histidine--tRNA ligase [Spirochaetales bacterium]
MPDIIEPRVLKGFRDYLPDAEQARNSLLSRLESVFRSFGFVPIDTPALEYAEILLGKGGGETDKQVYRFTDNGGREVALRFDLTVPFARFMAEHVEELYLPFRRYHMAKVWRGENTQRGRYREFMQCDFDIVGTDSASADADILLVIAQAIRALEAGKARIRVNHRALFNRFLARAGCLDKSVSILRSVDKIEKIGTGKTRELLTAEVGSGIADEILSFIEPGRDFETTLEKMASFCDKNDDEAMAAKQRLRDVYEIALAAGAAESLYLDPSITRGLDYYTGVVFETFLDDLPSIGSVCSGGRYNELAGLYTTRSLPGVGASVGLDRLLSAMEALKRPLRRDSLPRLLLANLGEAPESELHRIATALRFRGLSCEVYPEAKKLLNQYSFAQKKSIPFALLMDASSMGRQIYPLRDLERRSTREFSSLDELAEFLKAAKA